MTVRFVLVMLCTVLACGFAAGPGSTADVPPSRTLVLSPERVGRLTANGLKADDPDLSSQLKALAISRHSLWVRTLRKMPPPKVAPSNQTVWKVPISAPLALAEEAGRSSAVVTSAGIGLEDVIFDGKNLMNGSSATIVPSLSVSNCGVSPLYLSSFFSTASGLLYTGTDVPKNETAQLTWTINGVASKPVSGPYPADYSGSWGAEGAVDYLSPYYQPDYMGQATSSFATSGSHLSTNFSDPNASGTDTLGIGTNVLNGWVASAQISDVHSYMDAPGNTGANDVFRSATITQQPASGRLETKVAWTYEGGESISYVVTWIFTKGPSGGRQVSTQPKVTNCTDEQ